MIDYVLTVAVSVAAGVAAVTSALPGLFPHRESMGLVAIIFIVVMNLRGVRESGRFFALPTYLAIGALGITVLIGLARPDSIGRSGPSCSAQAGEAPT